MRSDPPRFPAATRIGLGHDTTHVREKHRGRGRRHQIGEEDEEDGGGGGGERKKRKEEEEEEDDDRTQEWSGRYVD